MSRDGRDGKEGRPGQRGEPGAPGATGPIPKHEWSGTLLRFQKPDETWGAWVDVKGLQGEKGESAYETALSFGFLGTKEEWVKSLNGKDGRDGKDGINTVTEKSGLSPFDLSKKKDLTFEEKRWLKSLQGPKGEKGEKGEKGDDGLSAYEVWLAVGHTGTEEDFFNWIASKVRVNAAITNQGAGPLRIKLSKLIDVDDTLLADGTVPVHNATTKKYEFRSYGGGNYAFTSDTTLDSTDGGNTFTNTGAGSLVTFLADAITRAGIEYEFIVTNANGITFEAGGTNPIQNGAELSDEPGAISSTEVGSILRVKSVEIAEDTFAWYVTYEKGTWEFVSPVASYGQFDFSNPNNSNLLTIL